MDDRADVIIVGAGSAGSVLAARLSEDPRRKVLLLEAGGEARHPLLYIPALVGMLLQSRIANWNYVTEPEPGLGGRSESWPRGKVLGGSSAINGMMWMMGRPSDFDGWAQPGLPDWSWERIGASYARLLADMANYGANPRASPRRALTSLAAEGLWRPLYEAFLEAGVQAGFPRTSDFNASAFGGVGPYNANIVMGRRWSAASAYLGQARRRPNLKIITHAHVLSLDIDKDRAQALTARVGGQDRRFSAAEIVLCGGAVNTPQLLMLSGVGPADHLRELGIAVRHDLPGVGANLHDHVMLGVRQACQGVKTVRWLSRIDRAAMAMAQYALTHKGPLACMPTGVGFVLRSRPDVEEPDLQGVFVPGSTSTRPADMFGAGAPDTIAITIVQLRPESRGSVRLRSNDPFAPPRLQANYLTDPRDRAAVRDGVRLARRLFSQAAFNSIVTGETSPGPIVTTDRDIDDWASRAGRTAFHPVGSCRMGTDQGAVVDGGLRVRGLSGLRIADASIMPRITSGNTNAPCMAIGQRCAELMTQEGAGADYAQRRKWDRKYDSAAV